MIGLRVGLRVNPKVGLAVGTVADEKGGVAADCTPAFAGTVTFNTVKRPVSAAQWTCVGSNVREPSYLWQCQESSGNLTDEISGLVLTAIGAVGYGSSVTDWTLTGADKWLTTSEAAANQGFYVDKDLATQIGWNTDTQSIFSVGYSCITAATASERVFWVLSGRSAESVYIAVPAAGTLKIYCGNVPVSNATTVGVYEIGTPTPFCWALQWDRRGKMRLTVKRLGVAAETIDTPSWSSKQDGGKGMNVDLGALSPVARHNMWAVWVGDDAEAMMDRGGTNAGGATLISDLGW